MHFSQFKLYHAPATRSSRVKWLLHELVGDKFAIEIMPLREAVQYGTDYLAKNPNHCVPTLEITLANGDSMNMIESGAMIALLADAFPEKGLAPPPDNLSIERADYLQILHFGASWMDMMLWQIRIHEHILPRAQRDPNTIMRYRKKFVSEVEPHLGERLKKATYICGNNFSAADCMIGHNILWARAYHLCREQVFERYVARISERPAFVSAFSDAHDFKLEVPEGSPIVEKFTG
jgi:glutathione S-transferase